MAVTGNLPALVDASRALEGEVGSRCCEMEDHGVMKRLNETETLQCRRALKQAFWARVEAETLRRSGR